MLVGVLVAMWSLRRLSKTLLFIVVPQIWRLVQGIKEIHSFGAYQRASLCCHIAISGAKALLCLGQIYLDHCCTMNNLNLFPTMTAQPILRGFKANYLTFIPTVACPLILTGRKKANHLT